MTYIVNTTAIILHLNNKTYRVEKTDKRYAKIIEAFKLDKELQEKELELILTQKVDLASSLQEVEGFMVWVNPETDQVEKIYYKGEELPTAFERKVISIIRDGLPLEHFEKFWQNLNENPSRQSVEELTQFLEYKELPITEDGHFLAYKGVQDNYYSSSGNIETKVLQGSVNTAGQIYNGIGEVIEVRRRDVDDNRSNHCSYGLHCGSLDYARGFAPRLIIVKVNPADVVSVPSDYSCQKCRVSKYEVVADYVEEITSSVVDEDGQETLVPNHTKERSEFVQKIATYLDNKRSSGCYEVTIRQIQNSLSPKWATRQQIFDALQELGEWWHDNEDGLTVVVLGDD